jgi:cyanophycinase
MQHGALALVGSGEYSESMRTLEAQLIQLGVSQGQGGGFVQIAAAAGLESDDRFTYWKELGRKQAQAIGALWRFLNIRDRNDALDPQWVEQVSGASLIYFSGGNPYHLADTFRDTPLWRAIVKEFGNGSSLAGCSAGAMFMGTHIPAFRPPFAQEKMGVNLIPGLFVLPHFDKFFGKIPQQMRKILDNSDSNSHVIGIDENTALTYQNGEWKHYGMGRVHLLSHNPKQIIGSSYERISLSLTMNIDLPS